MTTASLVSFLPDDLSGETVLDVGCDDGTVAREACRRNARSVVAVDIDESVIESARSGTGIDYRWADLEVSLPDGPFDHVVCHNLFHRVRNPVSVLDRLIERTAGSLIMAVTGPAAAGPARLLRRDYGATSDQQRWIAAAPLALVGRNGTPDRKREHKFFFSPQAMRHLLTEQRRFFAEFEVTSTEIEGRFVLRAVRRRVSHLVIVSGPTGAGKSTLLGRLQSEAATFPPQLATLNANHTAGYLVANSDGLRDLGVNIDGLLFHYDVLRPWRRSAAVHQRDEGLHVIDCASSVEVLVLVAPASVLAARLACELSEVTDQESRQARRIREVLDLYRHPARLIGHLERWLDFCSDKGTRITWLDSTNEIRSITPDRWRDVIHGRQVA